LTKSPPNLAPAGEVVTPTEVRQGSRGAPVLWVLLAAMLLCGIYLVATVSWTTTQPNDRNPTKETSVGTGASTGIATTGTPAADQVRR